MICYHIVDWERRFENNRTRDLKKLGWVPVPNHHDGDGYTTLMEMDNGMLLYAAWMLMIQVASKCGKRGTLMRDCGTPYDAGSLARVTRGQKVVFEKAIPVLIEIGWLSQGSAKISHPLAEKPQLTAEPPQETAKMPQPHACAERKKEVKGMEGKEPKEVASLEESLSVESTTSNRPAQAEFIYNLYPRKVGKEPALKAIGQVLAAKKKTFKELLTVTKIFAQSKIGRGVGVHDAWHPATFYNQGHYDDDQAEWDREEHQRNGTPPPYKSKASTLPTVEELEAAGMLGGPARPPPEGFDRIGHYGEVPT